MKEKITFIFEGVLFISLTVLFTAMGLGEEKGKFFFPQFGDGQGISSTLILTNPSTTQTATGLAKLFDSEGTRLSVDINGTLRSGEFAFNLPPRGASFFSTDGVGNLVKGSVQLISDVSLGGTVLFTGPFGVAGIGAAQPTAQFVIPIESNSSAGVRTGVAISNRTPSKVNITLTLRNVDGAAIPKGIVTVSLPANGQLAQFADEIFAGKGINFSQFSGTLEVNSPVPLNGTAIRVSPGEFASLPVSGVGQQNKELYFAHFANGQGISSTLILINPSVMPAHGLVKLFDSDGNPLSTVINGTVGTGEFTFSLPPHGVRFLSTPGTGNLTKGSVRVVSDVPLSGTILFAGPFGVAGIGAAQPTTKFLVPIESNKANGVGIGVALSNPTTGAINVALTLRDTNGVGIPNGVVTVSLPANGQLAQFPEEIFAGRGIDFSQFRGTLEVDSPLPVSGMAIRVSPSQFAAFPVTSLETTLLTPIATTPPTAFKLLTPVTSQKNVSLTATLRWTDSLGETGYTLQVDDENTFTTPLLYENTSIGADITSLPIPLGVLSPGATYFWRVVAVNLVGQTIASNSPMSFVTATPLSALPGPPTGLANGHIPDLPFPEPPLFDLVAPQGSSISNRDLLVIFNEGTTVSEGNALLGSLLAQVVGGNPLSKALLLRIPSSPDLTNIITAWGRVRTDPRAAAAALNVEMEEARLPPHNVDPGRWDWNQVVPPTGGNWGHKLIRVPQAWNLFDHAVGQDAKVEVLIVEATGTVEPGIDTRSGFDTTHPDLSDAGAPNPPRLTTIPLEIPVKDHGTMVSGIIGAVFHNGSGVEGVFPRRLVLYGITEEFTGTWEDTIIRLLKDNENVKIVNNSLGGSYAGTGINPVVDKVAPSVASSPTWRESMDYFGNLFRAAMGNFATGVRSDFLLSGSAGNDNDPLPSGFPPYEARDVSEVNNLAVRFPQDKRYIAVESVNRNNLRSNFSNIHGTISAPGEDVRSTEARATSNFDSSGAAWSDTGTNETERAYATGSGTSYASPHAAGLAAYLWALDSKLNHDQIYDLLTKADTTVKVGTPPGGAEHIDAFASTMGIDLIRGNKTLQKALVDVDDGTRDGNLRIDPLTGQSQDEIVGLRGDKRITMRDFRAWRDAFLQVHAGALPLGVALDGERNHFKKDLNFDNCVGTDVAKRNYTPTIPAPTNCANAPDENVYPRYDFNGDGKIGDWSMTAPFKIDPDTPDPQTPPGQNTTLEVQKSPGFLRDIDVLGDSGWELVEKDGYNENVSVVSADENPFAPTPVNTWHEPRYLLGNRDVDVESTVPLVLQRIPDYMHSFDLHIHKNWGKINPDFDAVIIRIESFITETAQPFMRVAEFRRGYQPERITVTIPLWTGKVRVTAALVDEDEPVLLGQSLQWNLSGLKFGQDYGITIQ